MSVPFRRAALGALFATIMFAAPALAHSVTVGSLTLTDLWTRATPPKAPTAAGYLTITNTGSEPDHLIAASTPAAGKGEIHIMEVNAGVMTMHPVEGGIEIPAGGSVTLAPGGYHLMFIGLKDALKEGGKMPVTLKFEKAGTVETFLHIMAIGAQGPASGQSGHDMGKMDTGNTETGTGGPMKMDHNMTGTGQ
jgi:periplasmic copper chaperone A